MGPFEFGSLHGYLDLGRSSVHTVFFGDGLILPIELKRLQVLFRLGVQTVPVLVPSQVQSRAQRTVVVPLALSLHIHHTWLSSCKGSSKLS